MTRGEDAFKSSTRTDTANQPNYNDKYNIRYNKNNNNGKNSGNNNTTLTTTTITNNNKKKNNNNAKHEYCFNNGLNDVIRKSINNSDTCYAKPRPSYNHKGRPPKNRNGKCVNVSIWSVEDDGRANKRRAIAHFSQTRNIKRSQAQAPT